MPIEIDRDVVRALLSAGAPVVDVLPADAYQEEHLAGAISLPLTELTEDAAARLNKDQPVVVYCNDYR